MAALPECQQDNISFIQEMAVFPACSATPIPTVPVTTSHGCWDSAPWAFVEPKRVDRLFRDGPKGKELRMLGARQRNTPGSSWLEDRGSSLLLGQQLGKAMPDSLDT